MGLEVFTFITSLNNNNPVGGDGVNQGDDHVRGTKTTLLNTFPNMDAAFTGNPADLNLLAGAAADGSGIATTGMISMFYGTAAPNAWLLCNGAVIDVEHSALINLVGANTPNLMGQFVRGWSLDNTVDPDGGRAPGDLQAEDFKSHLHASNGFGKDGTTFSGNPDNQGRGGAVNSNVSETGGDETRPVNMALAFIIKT